MSPGFVIDDVSMLSIPSPQVLMTQGQLLMSPSWMLSMSSKPYDVKPLLTLFSKSV